MQDIGHADRVDDGEDGLVVVHGLATSAWDAGDEAGRRLPAFSWCGCAPRRRGRWRRHSVLTLVFLALAGEPRASQGLDGSSDTFLELLMTYQFGERGSGLCPGMRPRRRGVLSAFALS